MRSLSIAALTQPAVPSGLNDMLSPPLSSNVYISLVTTSADSLDLVKSSVFSTIGNLISSYP